MTEHAAGMTIIASALALALAACAADDPQVLRALDAIDTADLAAHIRVLAADSFEGRSPASPGEEKTVAYLRAAFERLELEPGNGESYFQDVPLVSLTADPTMTLAVAGPGGTDRYAYGSEFMAWTKRVVDTVSLDRSEMVFVGYGIVAPEYGWNDYAGLDVAGKTVVMLVNDPGYATRDSSLFSGVTMTYYGRWTYKYEEAARQGAAAAIIVHLTGPAGYPWEVVSGSWSGPQFDLARADDNLSRVRVEGWVTGETGRALFRHAGLDFDSLAAGAATRGFAPVPLGLRASVAIRNTIRRSTSRNVLARQRGVVRPDEYVVYTAHWDHLGRDTTLEGDQIYNGAKDNATGTAGLLELAEAYTQLRQPPARSILFLAVTAEEQGLLGSKYYAANPVYPLHQTVAAINMDAMNILGPMRDVTVVGYGKSALDDYAAAAAAKQDRVPRPDPEPEKGFYYRSDHFEFAKRGVPSLYLDEGVEHAEYGEEWARQQRDAYTNERYHKPSDEFDADWDLRGLAEDLQLLFRVGHRLATESRFPNWREGTEFRAARDSMMAAH